MKNNHKKNIKTNVLKVFLCEHKIFENSLIINTYIFLDKIFRLNKS